MNNLVKICGLSTRQSIVAATTGGATHLGFIFFEKSPRNVTPEQAGELVSDAGEAKTVAVTVNATHAVLDQVIDRMQPDMLQLHGVETPAQLRDLKTRYGLPLIKALAVRKADDLKNARTFDGVADLLLLDAKPPENSQLPGGNGVSFDWSVLDGLKTQCSIVLSGGVNVGNVDAAMGIVRDRANSITGIDVSSGVESAPGVKDISKIEALLARCH